MEALTSLVLFVESEEIHFPNAVKRVFCSLAMGFPETASPKLSWRSVFAVCSFSSLFFCLIYYDSPTLLSMRSQTILLLKYSMGVHLMPSCTYSSWERDQNIAPTVRLEILQQKKINKKRGRKGHLLGLQGQLDEDLLQFLVHKVDAKLFKSIFLKKKKTEALMWERPTNNDQSSIHCRNTSY